MNLGKMFADSCSTYKDNRALVYENSRITFSEMDRAVNSLANRLKSMGIGKGDKAALMLPNTPEFPITYFACQKLGAVAVTLNVMSTSHELNTSSTTATRRRSSPRPSRRAASRRSGTGSPRAGTSC
ncbi:MAG: AMP-binding protein [Syntrophaceae bacterium]|nr:AMP-binding protein [Syntrophaceae bacterium]